MRAAEIIKEVAASDLYPRTFEEFRQKYLPYIGRKDLYVNFNDDVGNTLNKGFSPNPTHSDPSGLYAYPLEYVLNHPADIMYGQQARYLRVIQDTSSNKLVLTHMNPQQAVEILTRMGVPDPKKQMGNQQGVMQRKGIPVTGNKAAKLFFWVMQKVAMANGGPANKVQSALLMKAGIDAVEDVAQSRAEATIYPGEPEQIIFLKRSAFRVVEVFELRSDRSRIMHAADRSENLRRLPALIAKAIGDRLVAASTTGDRAGEQTFYTAEKRKIVVRLKAEWSQRSHRQHGDASPEETLVTVLGPDFKPIKGQYGPSTPFADIAADIGHKFHQREPGQGQEYSRESEHGPDIQHTMDVLTEIAKKLKVPFTVPEEPSVRYLIYKTLKRIEAAYSPMGSYSRAQTLEVAKWAINKFWELQKKRAPQADELINLYQAAFEKKKWVGGLNTMIREFGLEKTVQKAGGDTKDYGDMQMSRRGSDLVMTIKGKDHVIAKIDNNELDDWKQPSEQYDYTIALPYAKELCDYLNSQNFHTRPWRLEEYLPSWFGITYVDQEWKPLSEAAEQLETLDNGAVVWKVPTEKGFDVVVNYKWSEDHDWGHIVTATHNHVFTAFKLDKDNRIEKVSHIIEEYVNWQRQKEKDPNHYSVSGDDKPRLSNLENTPRKAWHAIFDAGFDPIGLIKREGWGYSDSLSSKEYDFFGLKKNEDNGKVGKDWAEIAEAWDTINGVQVYTIKRKPDSWSGPYRYYLTLDGGMSVLFTTNAGHTDEERRDISVENVAKDLSLDQRKLCRAIIRKLELPIPKKVADRLSIKGSEK